MGRLVGQAVADSDDLELVARFDPSGGEPEAGVPVATTADGIAGCDVVVEFTRPDAVMENLARWNDMGVHAVVGTSGFDAARVASVEALWTGTARCLIVPNFSIGAVVLMRLAELAAPHFSVGEVIELHHDRKADAPSGTALATAQRMAAAGGAGLRAVDSKELLPGALGAEADGVRIHSIRLPGLVAHQAVLFGGMGETLTIRHDTTDRSAFMPGVLLAIREVGTLADPVTVGLEALLPL